MTKTHFKHCKACEQYKDGYCALKRYKVSLNANFCDRYNERLFVKLRNKLKLWNELNLKR